MSNTENTIWSTKYGNLSFTRTSPPPPPKNCYMLYLSFMHGDGDAYEESQIKLEDNAEAVAKLFVDMQQCPDWPRTKDEWAKVPDVICSEDGDNYWKYDHSVSVPASLNGWSIYYYDENGVEYRVQWNESA